MFRGTQAITEWASDFVWQVWPLCASLIGPSLVMVHYQRMLSAATPHIICRWCHGAIWRIDMTMSR